MPDTLQRYEILAEKKKKINQNILQFTNLKSSFIKQIYYYNNILYYLLGIDQKSKHNILYDRPLGIRLIYGRRPRLPPLDTPTDIFKYEL